MRQLHGAQVTSNTGEPAISGKANHRMSVHEWGVLSVVALLFNALLLDGAIETQIALSPLRWWVTGSVSTYFVLLIAVWWWGGRDHVKTFIRVCAIVGPVAFLAILFATTFHPAGMSHGVRLLGQPISAVLSSVTLITILVFCLMWGLATRIDYRLRIGVSILALYGIFAFGLGLLSETPYPDLLQGHSFWSAVPYWLQGCVVGSFLFLPVVLIHQVSQGIISIRRAALQTWSAKVISLVLSISLALQGFMFTGISGAAAPATSLDARMPTVGIDVEDNIGEFSRPVAQPRPANKAGAAVQRGSQPTSRSQATQIVPHQPEENLPEPARIAEQFHKSVATLKDLLEQFNEFPLSSKAVVKKVGNDPIALFRWVQDNTAFVAYSGVLRGPAGVLADRDGNSLDRALLLQSVLSAAGYEARLAWGRLDDASATAIANNAEIGEARIQLSSIKTSIPRITEARERVTKQSRHLVQLLADTVNAHSRDSTTKEDIASHWWVQLKREQKWSDLDLLASGPELALTPASATYLPDELPEGLFHQVHIRLVLETSGQKQDRHLLLEFSQRAASLAGRKLHLGHRPLGVESSRLKAANTIEEALDTLAGAGAWMPLITFDGETIKGSLFTPDGEVLKPTDANIQRFDKGQGQGPASAANALNKQAQGIADMLNGGKGAAQPESNTVAVPDYRSVTAEWLEIEISVPERQPVVVRRTLFDHRISNKFSPNRKLDPATVHQKIAGLQRSIHLGIETSKLSGVALTDRLLRKFSGLQPFVELLEQNNGNFTDRQLQEFVPELRTLQTDLDYLAYLRWKTNPHGDEVYANQPNVVLFDRSIDRLTSNEWVAQQTVDIAFNSVGVRRGEALREFEVRLNQGVADTVSEALIYEASITPINTSVIHQIAQARGIGFTKLESADESRVDSLALPAKAKRLLKEELLAGNVVLIPDELIDLGTGYASWWRIDPNSGSALGMTSTGAGGAISFVTSSSVIEFVIMLAFTLIDVYFWADCVTGNQDKIFFAISIEGKPGSRFTLCTIEAFAMNALFAAIFKVLTRNADEIRRFIDDEAGSLTLHPKPHPDIPEGAHRIYKPGESIPEFERKMVGMKEEHMQRWAKLSKEDQRYAIVRGSNFKGMPFNGEVGYVPKSLDVKLNTGNSGLVEVRKDLSVAHRENLDDLLGNKGYTVKEIDGTDFLVDPNGNFIHGDHDMMGVYTSDGIPVKLLDPDNANPTLRSLELDYYNGNVYKNRPNMIQHDTNDNFFHPDYTNPSNEVGIPGRYPDSGESYFIADPDGYMHVIEGTENLNIFYGSRYLPWYY